MECSERHKDSWGYRRFQKKKKEKEEEEEDGKKGEGRGRKGGREEGIDVKLVSPLPVVTGGK